ncbi:hypothetical protein M3Y95_00862400 [Aphelenchoides besseyi]|nr:hypothetical protein M3Y95_00862400 [Aphelenchoides besseyi]
MSVRVQFKDTVIPSIQTKPPEVQSVTRPQRTLPPLSSVEKRPTDTNPQSLAPAVNNWNRSKRRSSSVVHSRSLDSTVNVVQRPRLRVTRTIDNDESSDDEDETNKPPAPALRDKSGFKKSQPNIPSCLLIRQAMRFTSELDPAAIDVVDVLQTQQPKFRPLIGFNPEHTFYMADNRLLTYSDRFLCQIDLTDCADERTFVDMRGRISDVSVSPKFDVLAVCVDFRRGSTVFVKEVDDITKTRNAFMVDVLATQMLVTPNAQLLVLLEIETDRRAARISVHNLADGKKYAESRVDQQRPSSLWELSMCPADEDVFAVLSEDSVSLLRLSPGILTAFSSVKIYNFTSHVWADDVTLAFGTRDGRLVLYRETIALETIDLGEMHGKLIADAQQANRAAVARMYATEQGLLVCVEIGVVFVFPPSDDEEDRTARWRNSKAIVVSDHSKRSFQFLQIESLGVPSPCQRLSMDPAGNRVAYADRQCVWLCDVRYAESVCREGMRLVAAQHAQPVRHLAVDIRDTQVCASLDSDGCLIVTSTLSKKLLALHHDRNVRNVAVLRGGNKLLLLTQKQLRLCVLLGHQLKDDRIIMENQNFQYLMADSRLRYIAILAADTLYVIEAEGLRKICYVNVGKKEEVLALKWSPDSTKIGLLSNQDTLTLVDVQNGQLLWTLDLKLRFFVDISVVDENIYAMGNKFMLSRLNAGKEMETNNVHQEGISLKASSTLLLSTQQVHFVSSSGGNVIRIDPQNPDAAAVVNLPDQSAITALHHDPTRDQIFVGFDDGKVICFEVMSQSDPEVPEDDVVHSNDFVLCPISQVLKYETELKNLSVQCNLIRDQSERILNDYKTVKEREISDLRNELESTLQAMREKMKRAEEKYEAIEASKEEAFARMQQEMNDTVSEQKSYYEKMINDQIKSAIDKEEAQTQQLQQIETDFRTKITQLQEVFKHEEKKWNKREHKSQNEIKKLNADLQLAQIREQQLHRRIADEQRQFDLRLSEERRNNEEQSKDTVYQIKQLKAYLLREREAKEASDATVNELRTELVTRNDELEKLHIELEQALLSNEQSSLRNSELSKQLEKLRRDHDVLIQKQKLLARELEKEKQLRHAHQRRLKHFEMLVDELSEHIYEPRRLEQNVLGLLAFFNSVPKSGQMQTNEQINSIDNQRTGVTKRVLHLGNSRNKAH